VAPSNDEDCDRIKRDVCAYYKTLFQKDLLNRLVAVHSLVVVLVLRGGGTAGTPDGGVAEKDIG
jgi:hypothetical protein